MNAIFLIGIIQVITNMSLFPIRNLVSEGRHIQLARKFPDTDLEL
jgi:hypothetical protein